MVTDGPRDLLLPRSTIGETRARRAVGRRSAQDVQCSLRGIALIPEVLE